MDVKRVRIAQPKEQAGIFGKFTIFWPFKVCDDKRAFFNCKLF